MTVLTDYGVKDIFKRAAEALLEKFGKEDYCYFSEALDNDREHDFNDAINEVELRIAPEHFSYPGPSWGDKKTLVDEAKASIALDGETHCADDFPEKT